LYVAKVNKGMERWKDGKIGEWNKRKIEKKENGKME
jgi:hypothetical protein